VVTDSATGPSIVVRRCLSPDASPESRMLRATCQTPLAQYSFLKRLMPFTGLARPLVDYSTTLPSTLYDTGRLHPPGTCTRAYEAIFNRETWYAPLVRIQSSGGLSRSRQTSAPAITNFHPRRPISPPIRTHTGSVSPVAACPDDDYAHVGSSSRCARGQDRPDRGALRSADFRRLDLLHQLDQKSCHSATCSPTVRIRISTTPSARSAEAVFHFHGFPSRRAVCRG